MQTECCINGEKCKSIICCKSEVKKLKLTLKQEKKLEDIIGFSKIMSDKTRGSIIYLIYVRKELCVCDFANILGMSSQAISNQLIKLYDKKILKKEKKGLTVFYSIYNKDFLNYLKHILE